MKALLTLLLMLPPGPLLALPALDAASASH